MLRYTTDRARPGLVALYDIRPGNGTGQFLQPRNPHGGGDDVTTWQRRKVDCIFSSLDTTHECGRWTDGRALDPSSYTCFSTAWRKGKNNTASTNK